MPVSAFGGDAALKSQMISLVAPRWKAGKLLPASILKWDPDSDIHSLCGALVESQDRTVFEARTGIPLECAMLCEALITPAIDVATDPAHPASFIVRGPDSVLSFGLEWLDAVRPGANLTDVVPRYSAYTLATLVADDFVLARHIEAPVRASADRILALWTQELAGERIEASTWSSVRRQAMAAAGSSADLWGHTIASFVEAIAWPVRGLAQEFVSLFQGVIVTWLNFVQRPYFSQKDQRDQHHALLGWKRLAEVSRDGGSDDDAKAALEALPASKLAMESAFNPDVKARRMEAHDRARAVTDPLLRGQMSTVLKLIAAA